MAQYDGHAQYQLSLMSTPSPSPSPTPTPSASPQAEIRLPTFAIKFLRPIRAQSRLPSITDFPSITSTPPHRYTLACLPPPELISTILDAFYACSGTLFYIISRENSFDLFRSIYWGGARRTRAVLGELCAIAAVGAQYDYEGVTEAQRIALWETAKAYTEDVRKGDEVRVIRVYTLCALFSIIEKRFVAMSYISAAMKIAVRYGLHKKNDEAGLFKGRDRIPYRKCWRSLKFLESWMVGTLGRVAQHLSPSDTIDITPIEDGEDSPTTPTAEMVVVDVEVVQTELGRIAFLMEEIMKNVYGTGRCGINVTNAYMKKLECWLQELPKFMRLDTLLSDACDSSTRRSILLVHLTYLGSMLLLTRPSLILLVSRHAGDPWLYDGTKEEARRYMDLCLEAAHNVATVVGIIDNEQILFKRCWLVIGQSFNSLTLLLFQIVQKQRHHRPAADYAADLASATLLVKVLLTCSDRDPLAKKFLDVVQPYARLFPLSDPNLAAAFPHAPPASQPIDLDALALHLLSIIRTPFGGDGTVETCVFQPPLAVSEESHAGFWPAKAYHVEVWRQDMAPTQKLPLKRLYDEADKEVQGYVTRVHCQVKKRRTGEGDLFVHGC